ncbi:hypothetical protein, partial [Sphingobacterium paramultivorum]|uniref:hypothetical protein n=1 Tax=Sphingobacterium paramultivorum TaxID=2886510 RepID=UPI001D0DBEA9
KNIIFGFSPKYYLLFMVLNASPPKFSLLFFAFNIFDIFFNQPGSKMLRILWCKMDYFTTF